MDTKEVPLLCRDFFVGKEPNNFLSQVRQRNVAYVYQNNKFPPGLSEKGVIQIDALTLLRSVRLM